jgi:hypothetical protein
MAAWADSVTERMSAFCYLRDSSVYIDEIEGCCLGAQRHLSLPMCNVVGSG